ncbi:MAG: DUF6142 family protein [Lachnospiraceae bacterium]
MFIKRKGKMTEEDRARELAKKREKQRKKMIRTRYGQKQKRHAKKGVQSCFLAALGCILLTAMIVLSFRSRGDVGILTGLAALITLIVAWRGLDYAVRGFRERDKNYITCKVGACFNGLLLLFMCGIFVRGLF